MDEDEELDPPAEPVPELLDLFNRPGVFTEPEPRIFHLQRDTDVSGVSGPGRVADGVLWPDGSCSVRWRGETVSIVYWASWEDMVAVHGHGGCTRFIFHDGKAR